MQTIEQMFREIEMACSKDLLESTFHHIPDDPVSPSFYFYHSLNRSNIEALKGTFATFVQPVVGGKLDYEFPRWLTLLINTRTYGYQA